MHPPLSRRDFLKLGGLLPLGLASAPLRRQVLFAPPAGSDAQNVLIIVFDALSAHHMSLYGYGRETTPNISRLAERAIVYHSHYAASNFTTPGTASLLTGALPWAHRAFHPGGRAAHSFSQKTIFRAFRHHHRVVYSHNLWVYSLCDDFTDDLDQYPPPGTLMLTGHGVYEGLFARDRDIASVAWARALDPIPGLGNYSVVMPQFRTGYLRRRLLPLVPRFPLGIPQALGLGYYLLEDAIDWLGRESGRFPRPYLTYVHLWPPHPPYTPPQESYGRFARDRFRVSPKPMHPLSDGVSDEWVQQLRRDYDEFILYVDSEFARLFERLEASGTLDDTWVILTSDHGELLDRGHHGHFGKLLYEPVIRVPLMIFEPGRHDRVDVHTHTSAVDLLPTLLHVTGQDPVDWGEGRVLPPFAPADPDRGIVALFAESQASRAPMKQATAAIVQHDYKLIYTLGYPELGDVHRTVELYDLLQDPEELTDLSTSHTDVRASLLRELRSRMREADQRALPAS